MGIRNAIIANFNDLETRDDIGALWENFLFIEKLKSNTYKQKYPNIYFWRTYTQKEIDYIEEINGQISAYEFKWNEKNKKPKPKLFLETYTNSSYQIINKNNYLNFLLQYPPKAADMPIII